MNYGILIKTEEEFCKRLIWSDFMFRLERSKNFYFITLCCDILYRKPAYIDEIRVYYYPLNHPEYPNWKEELAELIKKAYKESKENEKC